MHNSIVSFAIVDMTGKVVYNSKKLEASFGNNEITLNIDASVASGNYILQIKVSNQDGDFVQSKKLIRK